MSSTQRCQRATGCAGLGFAVGYIPKADNTQVAVCHTCFADAERVGFYCVHYGENEANAARRHDRIIDELHARAEGRRLYARALASGDLTEALGLHNEVVCRLLITDVFNPHGTPASAVLTVKRVSRDDAEQVVTSALYGLPDERREVLTHVYDGVVCDALNSCRSFGVEFKPRAVETVPALRGGDCILFVSLVDDGVRFDGFKGVSPVYLSGHDGALKNRLERLLAEARAALVFVMLEVECEFEASDVRPAPADEVVSESTHESPH